MKNKVLVELYVVSTNITYNVYLPVNEYIGKVIKMIVASSFELSDIQPVDKRYYLVNPETGVAYNNDLLLRDSDIKNAKKIYLI